MEIDIHDLKMYLLSNGWNMVVVGRYVLYTHPFTPKHLKIMDAVTLTQKWITDGASFNALPEAD